MPICRGSAETTVSTLIATGTHKTVIPEKIIYPNNWKWIDF
jgi:hypothetical protein